MATKTTPIPTDILERYQQLVTTQRDVVLKRATMPYTPVNGNMFSFIYRDGKLNLRLAKADPKSFLEQYKTEQSIQHGVIMKEYAVVPDGLSGSLIV
jgi:hypothetical protein